MRHLFRQYDIRGIAKEEKELSKSFTWNLGRALGKHLQSNNESEVFVGHDARLSSPDLLSWLCQGLEDMGIKTHRIEMGPTPLLYFATVCETLPSNVQSSSGIMITGSHNPPEYNGFKLMFKGRPVYGDEIQSIADLCEEFQKQQALPNECATFTPNLDLEEHYIQFTEKNITDRFNDLKVVVDAGNGAAGPLAVRTYKALGAQVIPLFCEPDGEFPNHHPDPTIPKNLVSLIETVIKEKADFGIAYDGDGDRIGLVSAKGEILFGDQILLYLAKDILKTKPGCTVISEVKASQIVFDELEKMGAKAICWKTGHSLIKAKLKETGAEVAGEMSGHIFVKDRFFGFDDAIYAGARMMEALKSSGEDFDSFLKSLPQLSNTPELRLDCLEEKKFGIVQQFVSKAKETFGDKNVLDIDGARIKAHGGWGLMRASNTQPVLVCRFEAENRENMLKIAKNFEEILKEIDSSVQLPVM